MQLTSPLRGLKKLRFHRGVIPGLAFSAVCNIAQWGYLLLRVRPQPDLIPLHYTTTIGIDRIGPWYSAFLLPISGTMILMLNFVLTLVTIEHQRVTAGLIVAVSIGLQLILVVSALLIFRTL